MPRTRVVHCKQEAYDVYIGRTGLLGNPYRIGPDGDRDEVLRQYERYLLTSASLLEELAGLRGKVLGCWCAPEKCHGHILAKYADLGHPVLASRDGLIARILVTGSRDWAVPGLIGDVLRTAERLYAGRRMLLVNGRCDPRLPGTGRRIGWEKALEMPITEQRMLTGADWLSARIAAHLGVGN